MIVFCGPLRKKQSRTGAHRGRCCDWCISIHFVFASFFFSFFYRRCGSVRVNLVLNFTMELNSVYTNQNCKVNSQQRNENSKALFEIENIKKGFGLSFLELGTCVLACPSISNIGLLDLF